VRPLGDRKGLLGLGRQGAEGFGVVHGQFGQHLAVKLDADLAQAPDEAAVGEPAGPAGRRQPRDPKSAEAFEEPLWFPK